MGLADLGVQQDSRIFFHVPTEFANSACYVVSTAGAYHCNEDYLVSRTYLDTWLIMLVDSGELAVEVQEKTQVLGAGMLALLDCRMPHRYYARGDLRFRWLHFTGCGSEPYYHTLSERYGLLFQSSEETERAVQAILRELESGSADEHAVSLAMHTFLAALARRTPKHKSPAQKATEQAAEFIELHYQEPLSLESIASVVALNPQYFLRQFKLFQGATPHEYLTSVRIRAAKQLLRTTDDAVEEIALLCGWNSASHFIRSFRKKVHITPHQFRKLEF